MLIISTESLSYSTSLQKTALFLLGASGSFMLSTAVTLRLKTQSDQAFGINLPEVIRFLHLYYFKQLNAFFSIYGALWVILAKQGWKLSLELVCSCTKCRLQVGIFRLNVCFLLSSVFQNPPHAPSVEPMSSSNLYVIT